MSSAADSKSSHCGLRCYLWFRWVLYLVLLTAAGILVVPFLRVYPEFIHSFSTRLPSCLRLLLLGSVAFLLAAWFFWHFRPRCSHGCDFCKNPPLWLAVALAVVAVVVLDYWWGLGPTCFTATFEEYLACFVGAAAALIVYLLWQVVQNNVSNSRDGNVASGEEPKGSTSAENWPESELIQWLLEEKPSPQDAFGTHWPLADQIADYLLHAAENNEPLPRVAVLGSWGSGKTTIVTWAKKLISTKDGRFLFCYASAWGFRSESYIHDLLQRAVQAIHTKTDASLLSSIPRAYLEAVCASHSSLHQLFNWLWPAPSWRKQFSRMNRLLELVDLYLVFIIEDPDRASGQNFDMEELTGFLEQIKLLKTDRVSFVFTSSHFPGGSPLGESPFPLQE